MTNLDQTALIAAGAVLAGDVAPGDDRDTITARHYTHPALDDRVVVRLVPAVLGVAEDLTCEFLGFAAPESTAGVGTGKRSALGFPAWALVNDPDNGHHALNLVKDVERLARMAKSRAGAAKDGFTALGDMLGRSAPHFLPTFYEQAGRIFLEHGNTAYAATMFGKAREAEEVHDLTVDPDRLREVFLEFAFAGALTAKALSAHARGLARKHDPDAAYELFLTLCVERTKGGLPPYNGMPEDLRRLARAAKRKVADEDERLLAAVLDTPAIDGASAGFWKSYRDALVRLARRDDAVRDQVLRFVPSAVSALDTWFDILTDCGAIAALTEPATGAPEAVSPADWLSSVCRVRQSGWRETNRSAKLLELAEAMAKRLAADGEPVNVLSGWRQHELDLADLLLAHGVPIAGTGNALRFDVGVWLADEEPGRRDLAALGSTGEYADVLGAGLVEHLRTGADGPADRDALIAAVAVPGLRTALAGWLSNQAGKARPGGLPGLTGQLRTLAVAGLPEAFADVPEAAETLAATDVAAILQTTLRTGLLDELGWPALEEAVTRLREAKSGGSVVVCGEGWPALALRRGEEFVVVGPDGTLAEHTSRIPADKRYQWSYDPTLSWFDGRFLVRWQSPDGDLAYWSDAPSTVFPLARQYSNEFPPTILMPDGSRFGGRRAVRPGDHEIPPAGAAHSDGTTMWTTGYTRDAWRWIEVDPATGDQGRVSLPSFLEDFAADGTFLYLANCTLSPSVPSTEDSPLGAAGGRHGWRVRRQADGGWLAEGVDGRRVEWPSGTPTPTGLLRLPGGGALVLSESYNLVGLYDADGVRLAEITASAAFGAYAFGTPFVAPRAWWHLLRPRDEAGSAALRQISREAVETLIAAAAGELEKEVPDNRQRYQAIARGERDELTTAIIEALPGISHPGLIAGVAGTVVLAATLERGYRVFGAFAQEARSIDLDALAPSGPTITDEQLSTALNWFSRPDRYRHSTGPATATTLPALLTALADAAQEPASEQTLPETGVRGWCDVLPNLASLAYRAASPLTSEEDREALVFALRTFADTGFADDGHHGEGFDGRLRDGNLRLIRAVVPEGLSRPANKVLPAPDGFIVLFRSYSYYRPGDILDGLQFSATAGVFALPDGWRLEDSTEVAQWFGSHRIEAFLDVLAERGPAPLWLEKVPELVEATGLSRAEATVLLAGMPEVDDYGATYLDAGKRKLLELSAAEAKAAKERHGSLTDHYRQALLAAAVPEDAHGLWDTGPDVAAIAEIWIAAHGVRQPVPDDILLDAAKQLSMSDTAEFVTGVVNPDRTTWLNEDSDLRFNGVELTGYQEGAFTASHLTELPGVLLWLAQRLPVGSELRARLPESLALARKRAAHPGFAVSLGHYNEAGPISKLLEVAIPPEGSVTEVRPWLSLVGRHQEGYVGVVVWPGLVGPADAPLFTALVELTEDTWLSRALDLLADERVAAACAATAPEGTDPAAAPQDPTVSAPHLVAEVAAKFGLDEDAAVLYLQLLALPDPTDANTVRWTGWKPARMKKARAALAATDLVLTAKRARAGRSLFLPGGWLALKSPHLPLETWKAPMFGIESAVRGVIVPREPMSDLFARAWQRVLDGDTPAYEELRTGGRR